MPSKLYQLFNKKSTPQSQPIPGSSQVENSAGGYSWELDPWQQFMRFLVLGTEGGTYYVSEQKLTRDNATNALKCLAEDGPRFVHTIVQVSANGRAYKNDPALFALALAAASEQPETRNATLEVLPLVARTGTHLFHFVAYVDGLRGWGRGLRQAVGRWYQSKDDERLAYQLAKYQSRDGWSHHDLLRLAHPKPLTPGQSSLFRWVVGKEPLDVDALPGLAQGIERLKAASSEEEVIALVQHYHTPREAIPTQFLTSPRVWEAMLPSLGITALIRNLGNLSKISLIAADSPAMEWIIKRISDRHTLRSGRVHPLQVLAALVTYSSGQGQRGKGSWR